MKPAHASGNARVRDEPPWWSAGVLGPRPGDDSIRRASGPPAGASRWRYRNERERAVILDVPGHEVSWIPPGVEVLFLASADALLAVAAPERPGEVLEAGRAEDLAERDA